MRAAGLVLAAAAALVAAAAGAHVDAKRALASSLIRRANGHKERSLREVLDDHAGAGPRAAEEPPVRPASERKAAGKKAREPEVVMEGVSRPARPPRGAPPERPSTLSELFAWAIASTTRSANASRIVVPPSARASGADTDTVRAPAAANRAAAVDRAAAPEPVHVTMGGVEDDANLLQRSVYALARGPPSARAAALLQLEELCHSVDNGRDLAAAGGVPLVSRLLRAHAAGTRAAAAWALATCSQNNPGVQNATVVAGAVPVLSALAARDVDDLVRSRALFALNAILESSPGRLAFEAADDAVPALRRSLVDARDRRAARRALNLAELLAGRNLEFWKTLLEAWDVPPLIERLMREHRDMDVRESAARVIAALDGRVLT